MKDVFYIDSETSQLGSYPSEAITIHKMKHFKTLPTGTEWVAIIVEYSIIASVAFVSYWAHSDTLFQRINIT